MDQQSISLKKYLKTARKDPVKAIEILEKQPDLAKTIWKGEAKWIPGSTPLHWAAHDGHLALVQKLLELGADIQASEADWWCRPIDWAADSGRHEVVQYLIDQGADMGGDKWSQCTPLHVVAQGGSSNGHQRSADYETTAEILIQAGVAVNAIAQYGGQPPSMTPLDDALKVGNETVAAVLVRHGGKQSSQLHSTD